MDIKSNIKIGKAKLEDAYSIIEYMNGVGGESENLLFGKDEFNFTIEQEEIFISNINNSSNSILLIAKIDEEVVSIGSLTGYSRSKIAHRGEIAISVKKAYWNCGIASMMMKELIRFGKEIANMEVIQLEVKADNKSAIHLYEKLGFKKIGSYEKFFKIGCQYYDAYLMNLYL